jgi:hypothetical protein
MCKPSCCKPHRSSGSGNAEGLALVAVLVIGADIALQLLAVVLRLIEIILLTTVSAAVLGLTAWALFAWHRRSTGRTLAIGPARRAPSIPPARVLIIEDNPATGLPAATRHGRYQAGRTARHMAVTADPADPAAAGDYILIRRVTRT